MKRDVNPLATLPLVAIACVLLTASASQERSGLHVFIISKRVGAVDVHQRVEGPFRGTTAAADREERRLNIQAAQVGERVAARPSVSRAGQCILVYQVPTEVRFRVMQNPSADIDRRLRMMRNAKQEFTIKMDKQCL